jgi:hypothetical protein
MEPKQGSAAAEVERLTKLRDAAEKGDARRPILHRNRAAKSAPLALALI